jgi:cell wall-associated NlpC family hydrolase
MIDKLGAAYEEGGQGPTYDCSGLVVQCLVNIGVQIQDRSVFDFISDGVVMRSSPPIYGPELAFATFYNSTSGNRHIAYLVDDRVAIHATTGSSLGEGVVASKISDLYTVKIADGYSFTGVYYLNPAALRFLSVAETEVS